MACKFCVILSGQHHGILKHCQPRDGFPLHEISVCVGGPLHSATEDISAFVTFLFIYFKQTSVAAAVKKSSHPVHHCIISG